MKRCLSCMSILLCQSYAWGIVWDYEYTADALPASPWTHGQTGGTSNVADGVLSISNMNGSTVGNNSWDLINHSTMSVANPVTWSYNSPDSPGVNWEQKTGHAFTIEWRMRLNGPATLQSSNDVGIKLEYGRFGNQEIKHEWYYDGATKTLRNDRQTWGSHEGRIGPEGAEVATFNDGFDGIDLGEWNTFRVTSASTSTSGGQYIRELWLNNVYLGRWWTDSMGSVSPELKVRTSTTVPDASLDLDYIRWANEPYGRYIYTPEPATVLLLVAAAGLMVRRKAR